MAALQHPRSGPERRLNGLRAPSRRTARQRTSRPANRGADRKLTSGFFRSAPPTRIWQLPSQVTNMHQESATYVFVFAPGCAVAPNNAGAWIDPTSKTLGFSGLGLSAAEFGSGAASIGSNWTIYANGWGGNQYVSTLEIGETAHVFGEFAAGASFAVDTYSFISGNPDMSATHYATNTGFGAVGLFGGPPGAITAGGYFLIDSFYPHQEGQTGGGAFMQDLGNWAQTMPPAALPGTMYMH